MTEPAFKRQRQPAAGSAERKSTSTATVALPPVSQAEAYYRLLVSAWPFLLSQRTTLAPLQQANFVKLHQQMRAVAEPSLQLDALMAQLGTVADRVRLLPPPRACRLLLLPAALQCQVLTNLTIREHMIVASVSRDLYAAAKSAGSWPHHLVLRMHPGPVHYDTNSGDRTTLIAREMRVVRQLTVRCDAWGQLAAQLAPQLTQLRCQQLGRIEQPCPLLAEITFASAWTHSVSTLRAELFPALRRLRLPLCAAAVRAAAEVPSLREVVLTEPVRTAPFEQSDQNQLVQAVAALASRHPPLQCLALDNPDEPTLRKLLPAVTALRLPPRTAWATFGDAFLGMVAECPRLQRLVLGVEFSFLGAQTLLKKARPALKRVELLSSRLLVLLLQECVETKQPSFAVHASLAVVLEAARQSQHLPKLQACVQCLVVESLPPRPQSPAVAEATATASRELEQLLSELRRAVRTRETLFVHDDECEWDDGPDSFLEPSWEGMRNAAEASRRHWRQVLGPQRFPPQQQQQQQQQPPQQADQQP